MKYNLNDKVKLSQLGIELTIIERETVNTYVTQYIEDGLSFLYIASEDELELVESATLAERVLLYRILNTELKKDFNSYITVCELQLKNEYPQYNKTLQFEKVGDFVEIYILLN